ncbi:NAD-dependent epimerase/dehydratase family protein [Saccharicrinis aurantiacus]|uniref:NAD-dependent epimerase/dehydratase family protein n=1 Tax=Saccharicrinis aurantiacus TaxID=1849719 RepID=UPI000838BD10|nr:NAD-dependent epimerase/dehydratase family protein [Saccharicrinis aurantiacus]
MGKRYLLTGASGFLGAYLYENLIKYGEVDTLGRNPDSTISCDLGFEVPNIKSCYDCLVHAAGKAHFVPRTQEEKNEFDNVNYQGVVRLLKGIKYSGKLPNSIIVISTVAVYGLEHGNDITEDALCNPSTPYGISKLKAENEFIRFGNEYDINIVILRLPLVIGKNPSGNLCDMIKAIKLGHFPLINGGRAQRSMVFAQDIAHFLPKIQTEDGVFNLTDSYHPSYKAIAKVICESHNLKEVFNIPKAIAIVLAFIGETIGIITKRTFPFNLNRYYKMTRSLTFSDKKAQKYGWEPRPVIEYYKTIMK